MTESSEQPVFEGIEPIYPAEMTDKLLVNTYYFWLVSKPDWNDGKPHRLRKKFKDARYMANLGYKVVYDADQTFPPNVVAPAGSQAALIFGARGGAKEKQDKIHREAKRY